MMKGLEIIKNGGEPLRIGADDGLLLVMFNHVDNDKVTVSDLYASVTEYATGDRYLYASEPLNQGDVYEVTYSEFNAQSSPIKLSHKGDKPISRPIKQDFIEPEYPSCSIDYKGYKSLKGFELEFDGKTVRGGLPEGAGIFVDAKNSSLQVSLKSIAADGTVYIWFYRELALGDKLTICFNEFPTASFTDPVVRSL